MSNAIKRKDHLGNEIPRWINYVPPAYKITAGTKKDRYQKKIQYP